MINIRHRSVCISTMRNTYSKINEWLLGLSIRHRWNCLHADNSKRQINKCLFIAWIIPLSTKSTQYSAGELHCLSGNVSIFNNSLITFCNKILICYPLFKTRQKVLWIEASKNMLCIISSFSERNESSWILPVARE